MNRILQCRKVPILAPRRFFNPKRVWKIGESERKEILQWISTISTAVKIHSIKEAGKNLILNHKIAYLSFNGTVNLAFEFTVGFITYILDLKLENHFIWLEKFFPERYETLKRGLTEGVTVPFGGFKLYEKEALIAGTVIAMKKITFIPRILGSIALFQPLAKWAGSSQKRIKQLRFRCFALFLLTLPCGYIGFYIFFRNAIQSSEISRMAYFYNSVKRKRDRKGKAYEIVLAETWEAENYKDDFDQIWNLDDEIFYLIDIKCNEDIKTQINWLQQNTVTETTQDE